MNATAKNGDVWTGERNQDGLQTWWIYQDTTSGALYESREQPAYRIVLDGATQAIINGKLTLVLS